MSSVIASSDARSEIRSNLHDPRSEAIRADCWRHKFRARVVIVSPVKISVRFRKRARLSDFQKLSVILVIMPPPVL